MTDPSKLTDIRSVEDFLAAVAYWKAAGLGYDDIAVKLGVDPRLVRPHVIGKSKRG